MFLHFIVIATIALSGLLAQGETDSAALLQSRGVTVLPLEDVTESPPQILDLTSNSARLNFVGTIPLACTLLYGETLDFGSASIDLNMNGGAIIEHNPLMLDLKPETTYYYRVQGSDEHGNFYVSETATFTTPAASASTSDNLLAPQNGATVLGVSSNFGGQPNDGSWGILRAVDGNPNTAWSTDGDGSHAWAEFQLAQRSHITQVSFWTRVMTDGSALAYQFTVTTDAGEVYGPFSLPDSTQPYTFDVDFEASTLRFDITDSSGGNTGAVEIAVYGTPVG